LGNHNILKSYLKELEICFSDKQLKALEGYLDMVYEYNKKFNLTGTKDKEGILVRHILDSIALIKFKEELFGINGNGYKVLDVGTGAGLPGIPLSIMMENMVFYLLESSSKKINFLEAVIKEINLKNIVLLKGRAEQLARETGYREVFNIVVSRAVAKFNILIELTIPFCRINGKIIFYKSKEVESEIKRSKDSVSKLGGRIDNLLEVRVPDLNEFRSFLVIEKIKDSPKIYPRNFNIIMKKSL
jgi:16S rRNA (guanine527-N7)-methyltransferase